MTRFRGATIFLLASIVAAFAAYVALTGGIDTRVAGIPVRSRSWERPAMLAAILTAVSLYTGRREVLAWIRHAGRQLVPAARSVIPSLPVAAAIGAGTVALAFGAFVAGGADSYGYVSQAELLAHARLTDSLPRSRAFTWPDVPYTLAPLGYRVGTTRHTIAPTYPPGFPLLMAPLAAIHPRGAFLIVPLCAAAAVWLCFRLGRELGEPLGGALSALLLAVSPTFLYQAVQPMSDVPVTAFWLGALLLARQPRPSSAAAAGVVTSLAILIRPNLAPLALFAIAAAATVSNPVDLRRALRCSVAILPGLMILAAIQSVRYGSPFASGYGSIGDLFALGNIGPNLARYPRWLTETHTPFIWSWVLAPIWIGRTALRVRPFAWLCYAFVIAVFAAYLPYSYFRPEEWFYTRFLLPAIPLLLIFCTCVVLDIARRVAPRAAAYTAVLLALGLASALAMKSVSVGAFAIRDGEQKYPAVGALVRERLPGSAFVMAMQHSGSIRYYSGRPTLRWDLLDRASLGHAVSALRAAGYTPFAVLDREEDEAFRKRFSAASPDAVQRMVAVGSVGGTQVYAFH